MKRILYLSFNDGSDTRINKEVASLCRFRACVEFVGLGPSFDRCFVARLPVAKLHFIRGKKKRPTTLALYFLRCAWLLSFRRFHSVHVVNEPQLTILWPFLWFQRRVVADVFDSVFLRHNCPGNAMAWLKRIVYAPAGVLIVTDCARRGLMPDNIRHKTIVLPNYPPAYPAAVGRSEKKTLTIVYFGWLGLHRGTETLLGLLDTGLPLTVIMAGWPADRASEALTRHPQVLWKGTLPQEEALRMAAAGADYILCVYAPLNTNNIYASPNKLYDAIQIEKPVIINAEARISAFVRDNRLGYVVPRYEVQDYAALYADLIRFRNDYHPRQELKRLYTWEQVADQLQVAHRL